MTLPKVLLLGSTAATLLALAAGCSSTDVPGSGEATGSTQEEALTLSTSDAIGRAELWVAAKLPYCQSANHARDYDQACSTYCSRPNNPEWDPYRSDCSGLVSWAWGLPSPGRVTTQFAPFQNDITHTIAPLDLQEGDALNNSDHVMLFKEWKDPGKSAVFIEEPGCSTTIDYAHEFTSNVTITNDQIHVAYVNMTFSAIRYTKLTSAPAPDAGAAPAPDAGASAQPPPAASADPASDQPPDDGTGDGDMHAGAGCAIAETSGTGSSLPVTALVLAGVLALGAARRRHARGAVTGA